MSETTLGALARTGALSLGDGYRTKQSELADDGFRIIRVADVKDGRISLDSPDFVSVDFERQIGTKRAVAGDVLLTTKGSVGRVAVMPESDAPAVYSPQLCWFRVSDSGPLIPRFLAYWLQSAEFLEQASYMQGNTDMAPYISLADLRSSKIILPRVAEQQAIAEVLGALDDKIAANIELERKLSTAVTLAYVAATVSDASENSLLTELNVEFGEPFSGSGFSAPGVGRPLIRIRDLKTFAPQVWTTESRPKEVKVVAGDVLVGMDAEFRATPWHGVPGVMNQRVLRASHVVHGRALVLEMLKRPLAQIENEKSATTVIHLNKSDLARKTVVVPSEEHLRGFEAAAEPQFAAGVSLLAENRTLAATRDALLPQLMSGKLRVRDAEFIASDAGL